MSHFTVLIIGDDIEGQLAPYDENMQAEPYRENEDVDIAHIREYAEERRKDHADWVAAGRPALTADVMKDNAGYYKERGILEVDSGESTLPAPDADDLEFVRWYHGMEYHRDDDGQWYRMSTYNPDSKWDWYQVGGRWAGFFKTKGLSKGPNISVNPFSPELAKQEMEHFEKQGVLDGMHTDQARKREIDFQGMRDDAAFKAGQLWDLFQRTVEGTPEAESWTTCMNRHIRDAGFDPDGEFSNLTDEQRTEYRAAVDVARKVYHDQPRVRRLNEVDEFRWGADPEDYAVSRGDFCAKAASKALSTFAVLLNGEWIAKGDMGWFGMSNDTVEQAAWADKVNELIEAQDDDTLFTLVDCHI